MANKRVPISKKIRYEVLKRDRFTCQYCGREAPDVVLEIDHIIPVSKGGDNSIVNLITSCKDCNRGKGKNKLQNDVALKKEKKQLDDLQERKEQIELMAQWKKELINYEVEIIDSISEYLEVATRWGISNIGRIKMKSLVKRFGVEKVYEAIDIAYSKYFDGTERSWQIAFDKIGGICYNREQNITYEEWKNRGS